MVEGIMLYREENIKEGKLTRMLLKTKTGEFDIDSIHSLVLRGCGLVDLGCICECNSLERLDLSDNKLTRLYALAGLPCLSTLNLSGNHISSLEGLQALENLHTLNVAGNNLSSMDSIRWLTGVDKLRVLRLHDPLKGLSNPICQSPSYKKDMKSMFPGILSLDGERLHGRGSEVYRMCEEIEEALKVKAKESPNLPENSDKWIPDGFWEMSSSQFDQSNLHDAEDQLKMLLESCHHLKKQAEASLEETSGVS